MAVGIELIPGVITIFLAIIGMELTGFHRLDKRTGKRIAIDNRDADKLIEGVVLYVAGVVDIIGGDKLRTYDNYRLLKLPLKLTSPIDLESINNHTFRQLFHNMQ